jgi:hypothetical protein
VAAQTTGVDQIDRPVADDLIAHLGAAHLDVAGLGWELAHGPQSWPARTIQKRDVTPPSQTSSVDASELRARARQEADELGPEPPGTEAELWREERWGAVVLLAG